MTRGNNHIRSLLAPVSSNVKPHPKRLTTHKSLSRQACGQCSSENDATGSARSRFSSRKEQRPPDIAAELPRRAAADSLATYVARAGSIRETTEGITIMWKKFNVTVLAVLAFGFASALRLNAGTEVVEPYRAPRRVTITRRRPRFITLLRWLASPSIRPLALVFVGRGSGFSVSADSTGHALFMGILVTGDNRQC